MTPEDAIVLCDEILELIEELPDDAEDFGMQVGERVDDIKEWIEDNERCTDPQATALENMKAGVERWIN